MTKKENFCAVYFPEGRRARHSYFDLTGKSVRAKFLKV